MNYPPASAGGIRALVSSSRLGMNYPPASAGGIRALVSSSRLGMNYPPASAGGIRALVSSSRLEMNYSPASAGGIQKRDAPLPRATETHFKKLLPKWANHRLFIKKKKF